MDSAARGTWGRSSDPWMPADTRPFMQKIALACRRRASIYPSPLIQICSTLLLYRWGFVLLSRSLGVSSLLWPGFCLGWPRYPSKIPWTLGIFLLSLWRHTFLGWASCCRNGGCQMFLWGRPNGLPLFSFSLAYRQHRPGHFSQSVVQTSCSWAFDMSCLHFWGKMALLHNRRGPG